MTNSKTPEPIHTKFDVGFYVEIIIQQAKNSKRSLQGGRPGKKVKYYS